MNTYSYTDVARYAENDMTAEERQAFEQALSSDADLQKQLAMYHDVHGSLQQHFTKDARQAQLEDTLQQMRGEFFSKASAPAKVISMKRVLRYAMGVAAVLLIAVFLWKPWQSTDLYGDYAQTDMINPAVRGENTDSLLQQAAVAFNAKDFATAEKNLEQVRRSKPDDSFTNFYYGVSLLQNGKVSQARVVLSALANGESTFKYEATFYQALSFLKEGDKTACREWLQKIPADAANYGKARELLDKL